METRHKYEYQVNLESNTAAANVVRMVGSEKRVLEIGAGPGSITKLLIERGNCHMTAIELDDKAIEKLSVFCSRVYKCDLNDPAWASTLAGEEKFEAIVIADVLEHLYNPWRTLGEVKTLLKEDGYVVVSLPHIGHNAALACILNEDFEYKDWGLLDKTHIRFFCMRNIQHLFNDAGLKIVEAEFVIKSPERTEFAKRWRQLPSELQRALSHNRFGNVYQIVVKAKLGSARDKGIQLVTLPVLDANAILQRDARLAKRLMHHVKGAVLPYLSLKNRARIGRLLVRLRIKI